MVSLVVAIIRPPPLNASGGQWFFHKMDMMAWHTGRICYPTHVTCAQQSAHPSGES